ncbi:serine protease [Pilimelia anulata]|uniref:Serine protease n=1 Tax=Pilimelia anulata TaxID=53371 RepID=A0A8J3BCY2_9ACTN|nr:S1 family peptidase [Pilimelia anulata]GGK10494.1 serine protease [Pilimelia anulata]
MPAGLAEAVQRDLGLTPDQARARWASDHRASLLEHELTDRLGAAFGGAWIEGDGLVVAVTTEAAAAEARAAGARAHLVARSAADLAGVVADLDATRAPASVGSWGTDVRRNEVVVSATSVPAAESFVAAAGVPLAGVRIERTTETPKTIADIIGGNAYYPQGSRCSVGFPVEGGFATAGHCGKTGTATTQPTGSVAGSTFPGRDIAWVRISSADRPVGAVNDYKGGRVPVAGSTQASVGAQICRSGSTTQWRCGSIQAFNETVNYPQGSVNGLAKTSACAEPGDSGGSFLAGSQAQGVASGASGKCPSGQSWYQPLNPILQAYSLTLLTSGGAL